MDPNTLPHQAANAPKEPRQASAPDPTKALQHITLRIDGISFPLDIPPEHEQIYRQAALLLNGRITKYKELYSGVNGLPANAYLLMAALQTARQEVVLSAMNSQERAYGAGLEQINSSLEQLLDRYSLPAESDQR